MRAGDRTPRARRGGQVPWRCLCATLLGACVAYEPQELELAQVAEEVQALAGGQLSFAAAVTMALRQNPELQALAAAARAAGADVPATELAVEWDGMADTLALMVDPLALLGLAQRGAAADVAAARGAEALAALAVARWRVVGEIAEAFAVGAALATLAAPRISVDPEPFVRAGLASPAAAAQLRAAAAGADAERQVRSAELLAMIAELRRLLGLPASVALTVDPVAAEFPPLPPLSEPNLLQRPDLALAMARYRLADAEFRRAVADQYPSLVIGPYLPLRSGVLDAVLRVPLGADGPARAAQERRTGARAIVVDALLAADNAASRAVADHEAAHARAAAATASAAASATALAAASAELQVEVDVFDRVAERATMAVREAMERREAVVAAARARVRRAVACGWPVVAGEP